MVAHADSESSRDARTELRGRVWRAFSLRRNLRVLFVPPEGRLRPVDGWRALSILWVLIFHSAWYSAKVIPMSMYTKMVFSPWLLPIWRGDFGVDIFFVISGFLIAGMLFDERARTGKLRLGLFYVRRLLRLWPTLAVAVFVDALLRHDHVSMVWANLLYVSNFIPIVRVAMVWTWSLSIEEQFYLVCPWLVKGLARLRNVARAAVFGSLVLLLFAIGAWVVAAGNFHAIDAEIVVNRGIPEWIRGFDALYVKPWMRAGPLLMGVCAAYVFRSESVMEAFARKRIATFGGLVVAFVLALVSTHWPLFANVPRAVEIAYLASYRTVFGAAIAYMVLLSLSQHPLGQILGRILSSRWLYPVGQLAYSAYLLNPTITMILRHFGAPLVADGKTSPLWLFGPVDLTLTLLFATLLYLFVERPSMELRPKAG